MTKLDNTDSPVAKANLFLLVFAGFCLLIALAIAWLLGITLFYPNGAIASHIVDRSDIIRAHIDYLMMAQFLFIFFLLFKQFAIKAPAWVVFASCFGAFFNPLAFLSRGFSPKPDPAQLIGVEPHFPFMAGVSFTLTTVGFLTCVGLVIFTILKNQTAQSS